MAEERDRLKAELRVLNGRIQAERNDEVRHALQRARLEVERAELLVKLVESAQPALPMQSAYSVVVSAPPIHPAASGEPKVREVRVPSAKPTGLPSMPQMVLAVLEKDAPDTGMRPIEVADAIRHSWWPSVKLRDVNPVLWRLASKGRLENTAGRYRLNGHGDTRDVA